MPYKPGWRRMEATNRSRAKLGLPSNAKIYDVREVGPVILERLRKGDYFQTACKRAGISVRLGWLWRTLGNHEMGYEESGYVTREEHIWFAQAVDLKLGDGGEDLADHCKLHGAESLDALRKLVKSRKAFIEWVKAGEMRKLPPIEWLVPNEIPENGLVVLFGQPGIGKSFIALDYSLWIGLLSPVLYVAAEGYRGFANRVSAWSQHFKHEPGEVWFASGNTALTLLDPVTVEKFVNSAMPKKPKMIVFDTLACAMVGGDENTVRDMQMLINHCRIIQERLQVAVILVHHSGKANTSERGSSALRGGADVMIEVVSDDDLVALVCIKSKDAEPFPKRWLRPTPVQLPDGQKSLVVVPTEAISKNTVIPISEHQRAVLEILSQPLFLKVGARASQLVEMMPHVNKGNLFRLLNKLMSRKLIDQEQRGEPYRITEKGLEALGIKDVQEAMPF